MIRAAYRVWKARYPQGGPRFIFFITMGTVTSVVAFLFGVAYISGLIRNTSPTGESYRPAGFALCASAVFGLLVFWGTAWWYSRQDSPEEH